MRKYYPTSNFVAFVVMLLYTFILLASCSSRSQVLTMPSSSNEIEVRTFSSSSGPKLGVVVDKNFVVLDLEDERAAAVAGVQLGDQLIALEAVPFAGNREKIKDILRSSVDGDKTLVLKLERDGKEMLIEIRPSLAVPVFPKESDTPIPTVTPVWPPNDYY